MRRSEELERPLCVRMDARRSNGGARQFSLSELRRGPRNFGGVKALSSGVSNGSGNK